MNGFITTGFPEPAKTKELPQATSLTEALFYRRRPLSRQAAILFSRKTAIHSLAGLAEGVGTEEASGFKEDAGFIEGVGATDAVGSTEDAGASRSRPI